MNIVCPKGHNKDITGRTSDGHCKVCRKTYSHSYIKQYYIDNKEQIQSQHKEYRATHQQEIKIIIKDWIHKNKQKVKIHHREYEFNRRKTDLEFKLKKNLRHRLYLALKRGAKKGSAVKDLGCSISEFKQYIESKFYSNMSWDNWGSIWELDHIKPLYTFDLVNRNEFLKAVHYTNFQPLTIEDHRTKSNEELKVKSHDR